MLILQSLKPELLLLWKNEKCALKNTNLIKWTETLFYFFYKIQLNDLKITKFYNFVVLESSF